MSSGHKADPLRTDNGVLLKGCKCTGPPPFHTLPPQGQEILILFPDPSRLKSFGPILFDKYSLEYLICAGQGHTEINAPWPCTQKTTLQYSPCAPYM